VELLIWHTAWLLLRMRTAREIRQEFVKSPSFVFEQISRDSRGTGKMAASNGIFIYETRPPLHIDECWSQLREYLKVKFYWSYIFYLKLY
jgi:hypothetical protein